MLLTDDDRLAERCRSLRNLCFQPEKRFVHEELGYNFRMTNLQAALGLAQLSVWRSSCAQTRMGKSILNCCRMSRFGVDAGKTAMRIISTGFMVGIKTAFRLMLML
jgi:hypothetical protein